VSFVVVFIVFIMRGGFIVSFVVVFIVFIMRGGFIVSVVVVFVVFIMRGGFIVSVVVVFIVFIMRGGFIVGRFILFIVLTGMGLDSLCGGQVRGDRKCDIWSAPHLPAFLHLGVSPPLLCTTTGMGYF